MSLYGAWALLSSAKGICMETSVFLKKLIFALTTGSILVYLVSFRSMGETNQKALKAQQCRVELIKVRSGRPVALKYQYQVVPSNVLTLTDIEQKMVTQYMKKTGHSLVNDGIENPFLITTYRMESPTRTLLGYKVVVDTVMEDHDVMTYYLTKRKKLLFWYLDAQEPQKQWSCQI